MGAIDIRHNEQQKRGKYIHTNARVELKAGTLHLLLLRQMRYWCMLKREPNLLSMSKSSNVKYTDVSRYNIRMEEIESVEFNFIYKIHIVHDVFQQISTTSSWSSSSSLLLLLQSLLRLLLLLCVELNGDGHSIESAELGWCGCRTIGESADECLDWMCRSKSRLLINTLPHNSHLTKS